MKSKPRLVLLGIIKASKRLNGVVAACSAFIVSNVSAMTYSSALLLISLGQAVKLSSQRFLCTLKGFIVRE